MIPVTGSRTWRAALVVFVSVLVTGLALGSASALWSQQVEATTGVRIGTWATPTPTPTPAPSPTPTGPPPSAGDLTSSFSGSGVYDGYFKLYYHLWWGQSLANEVEFFSNGTSLGRSQMATTGTEQHAEFAINGLANGTYKFTCVVRNASGQTACKAPVTVTVTQANPGMPVLSYDPGTRQVVAHMYYGTNATSFRLSRNGAHVASGQLTASTPNKQVVRVPVGTLAKGRHEFVMVFTNQFGSTTAQPLVVQIS